MTEILSNEQIYEKLILHTIPKARKYIWIATADIKDMYVKNGKRMIPFLEILGDFIKEGILVRIIHAKEPGVNFRTDFDKNPVLIKNLERMLCPRNHLKLVIIDGKYAFMGSANLTGAGMGAKSRNRRNFECGILTDDKKMVKEFIDIFDSIWIGTHCKTCGRKEYCAEYEGIIGR
jgi:phosphatidylserine/phosphatidylglycerophosphate/cardiolipin synthase-like enzyme